MDNDLDEFEGQGQDPSRYSLYSNTGSIYGASHQVFGTAVEDADEVSSNRSSLNSFRMSIHQALPLHGRMDPSLERSLTSTMFGSNPAISDSWPSRSDDNRSSSGTLRAIRLANEHSELFDELPASPVRRDISDETMNTTNGHLFYTPSATPVPRSDSAASFAREQTPTKAAGSTGFYGNQSRDSIILQSSPPKRPLSAQTVSTIQSLPSKESGLSQLEKFPVPPAPAPAPAAAAAAAPAPTAAAAPSIATKVTEERKQPPRYNYASHTIMEEEEEEDEGTETTRSDSVSPVNGVVEEQRPALIMHHSETGSLRQTSDRASIEFAESADTSHSVSSKSLAKAEKISQLAPLAIPAAIDATIRPKSVSSASASTTQPPRAILSMPPSPRVQGYASTDSLLGPLPAYTSPFLLAGFPHPKRDTLSRPSSPALSVGSAAGPFPTSNNRSGLAEAGLVVPSNISVYPSRSDDSFDTMGGRDTRSNSKTSLLLESLSLPGTPGGTRRPRTDLVTSMILSKNDDAIFGRDTESADAFWRLVHAEDSKEVDEKNLPGSHAKKRKSKAPVRTSWLAQQKSGAYRHRRWIITVGILLLLLIAAGIAIAVVVTNQHDNANKDANNGSASAQISGSSSSSSFTRASTSSATAASSVTRAAILTTTSNPVTTATAVASAQSVIIANPVPSAVVATNLAATTSAVVALTPAESKAAARASQSAAAAAAAAQGDGTT